MSTETIEQREKKLLLCRDFLSAELRFKSSGSEMSKIFLQDLTDLVLKSGMNLEQARKLATPPVTT